MSRIQFVDNPGSNQLLGKLRHWQSVECVLILIQISVAQIGTLYKTPFRDELPHPVPREHRPRHVLLPGPLRAVRGGGEPKVPWHPGLLGDVGPVRVPLHALPRRDMLQRNQGPKLVRLWAREDWVSPAQFSQVIACYFTVACYETPLLYDIHSASSADKKHTPRNIVSSTEMPKS